MRKAQLSLAMALLATLVLCGNCRTSQSPERQANDLAITAAVKSRLASEVRVSTITNIDVNTTNGVVT